MRTLPQNFLRPPVVVVDNIPVGDSAPGGIVHSQKFPNTWRCKAPLYSITTEPLTPERTIPSSPQNISIKKIDKVLIGMIDLFHFQIFFGRDFRRHLLSWALTKKCEPLHRGVRKLLRTDNRVPDAIPSARHPAPLGDRHSPAIEGYRPGGAIKNCKTISYNPTQHTMQI